MKRTIRFRVWDNDAKRMLPNTPGITSLHQWPDGSSEASYYDGKKQHHNVRLMQFTGLHDKNGRKIYEGDVIDYDNGATAVRIVVTYELRYDGDSNIVAGFYFNDSYNVRDDWDTPTGKGFEVIGNVFETPELVPQAYNKGKETQA